MKLSELDEVKKVAAEWRRLVEFEKVLASGLQMFDISFEVRRLNVDNTFKTGFSIRSGADMEALTNGVHETIKKQREELQAKLMLFGIDDFEGLV